MSGNDFVPKYEKATLFIGSFFWLTVTATAQETKWQDSARNLEEQVAQKMQWVDRLRNDCIHLNDSLVYTDSIERATAIERQTVLSSPRWRLDRHRVDSLRMAVRRAQQNKAIIQNRFDRQLVILDSAVGILNETTRRLSATKKY